MVTARRAVPRSLVAALVSAVRAVLPRSLVAALMSAVLVVLAAAMVTGGGDTVRGAGPVIHPAAEITPNALPRTDADQQPAGDAAPDDAGGQTSPGAHDGPDSAAVVTDAVPPQAIGTIADVVRGSTARPAAPVDAGPADGRAPPEPVAA